MLFTTLLHFKMVYVSERTKALSGAAFTIMSCFAALFFLRYYFTVLGLAQCTYTPHFVRSYRRSWMALILELGIKRNQT